MAIHIVSEVWEHSESTGSARLVLLALADNADRTTREAWPSVRDLARRTHASERSVQRALRELAVLGEIESVAAGGFPRRPTRYRVLKPRSGRQAVTPPDGRGDTDGSEGRHEGSRRGDASDTRTVIGEPLEEPSSPPKSPTAEHPDFEDWLAHHEQTTGRRAPRPGTTDRANVSDHYTARRAEGYGAEDLKLATVGAFSDGFRRTNGHYGPVSVLRKAKVHDLVEKGRTRDASGRDLSRFDRVMER